MNGFSEHNVGKVIYNPIGVIKSPFDEPVNMPIQSVAASGISGTVELYDEFDSYPAAASGWVGKHKEKISEKKSDKRFVEGK